MSVQSRSAVVRMIGSVFCMVMLITASGPALPNSPNVDQDEAAFFRIQIDILENGRLSSSPTAVLREGRSGTISAGDLKIELLVQTEGMVNGKPALSLTVLASRGDKRTDAVTESLLESTLFLLDSPQAQAPATLSVGSVDLVTSVLRIEPSAVAALWMEARADHERQSSDPITPSSRPPGRDD
ncbi:MAG: hypothetical protein ACXIUM_05955 [Wenzhouxiangella sp.]